MPAPTPLDSPEEPPAVVALHGFAGSGDDFSDLAARAGIGPWWAPTLPGHATGAAGALPQAPLEDAAAAAAFAAWADDLLARLPTAPGPLPLLLGYSLGGRLALHLAARSPARWCGLVLIGAGAGIADPALRLARRASDETWARRALAEGMEAFLRAWEAQPLLRPATPFPADWAAARARRRARLHPTGLACSLRTFGQGSLPAVSAAALAAIGLPVLLVAGEHDPAAIGRAREMAAHLPRATIGILSAAGHAALFEQPAHFTARLRHWLGQQG